MPTEYDDDLDDDDDDDDLSGDAAAVIARLRETNRGQKKALREATRAAEAGVTATKKLAFIEAKLPDTPQVKFFLDNYKGDYTADAIRTQAAEYGFIEADPGIAEEVDTVTGMVGASQGATSLGAPGTDKALIDEINAVSTLGKGAADEIERILARSGRLVSDE